MAGFSLFLDPIKEKNLTRFKPNRWEIDTRKRKEGSEMENEQKKLKINNQTIKTARSDPGFLYLWGFSPSHTILFQAQTYRHQETQDSCCSRAVISLQGKYSMLKHLHADKSGLSLTH